MPELQAVWGDTRALVQAQDEPSHIQAESPMSIDHDTSSVPSSAPESIINPESNLLSPAPSSSLPPSVGLITPAVQIQPLARTKRKKSPTVDTDNGSSSLFRWFKPATEDQVTADRKRMRLEHQEHVDKIRANEEVACQKAKERKADLTLARKQRERLRKKEAEIESGKRDANGKIRVIKVRIWYITA